MLRKISAVVASTLVAAGIILFMLFRVKDDLMVALEHIVWGYLALAAAICLLAWLLRGLRYKIILSGIGICCSFLFSTGCIFVSQTANLIVPARLGDMVRVFMLKHEYGTGISQGISSIVVERVFDIVTVALLGAVSLLFVFNVPDEFLWLIILTLVLGAGFFIFLSISNRFVSNNRYISILLAMLDQIRQVALSAKSVFALSTSSIVIWLLDVLVCLLVAMMFGVTIPFAVVMLAIVVGNLVKAIPLTPGGVGTYELAVAAILTAAGVEPAVATLIAVIDHLIKNLVTLGGGVIAIYFFGNWVLDAIKSAFRKESRRMTSPGYELQFLMVAGWLILLVLLQLAVWPALRPVLKEFAFPAAFPASLLLFTLVSWYCGLLHIPLWIALIPFASLLLWFAYKGYYRRDAFSGQGKWALVFFVFFFFMLELRFINPSISFAEKFMDHAFLASVMRTPVIPPTDPWFLGGTLDVYYYLGYWMFGALGILSGVPSNIVFNLALPTVLANAAVCMYALGHLLSNRLQWLPLLTFLVVNPSFIWQAILGKSPGAILWDRYSHNTEYYQ